MNKSEKIKLIEKITGQKGEKINTWLNLTITDNRPHINIHKDRLHIYYNNPDFIKKIKLGEIHLIDHKEIWWYCNISLSDPQLNKKVKKILNAMFLDMKLQRIKNFHDYLKRDRILYSILVFFLLLCITSAIFLFCAYNL